MNPARNNLLLEVKSCLYRCTVGATATKDYSCQKRNDGTERQDEEALGGWSLSLLSRPMPMLRSRRGLSGASRKADMPAVPRAASARSALSAEGSREGGLGVGTGGASPAPRARLTSAADTAERMSLRQEAKDRAFSTDMSSKAASARSHSRQVEPRPVSKNKTQGQIMAFPHHGSL